VIHILDHALLTEGWMPRMDRGMTLTVTYGRDNFFKSRAAGPRPAAPVIAIQAVFPEP
jgi:hypothetical protein